ncbi:uncharacterized protein LOC131935139 isoform X2 [Physella acuta]|uniref:uncharacterized protein LOC131935139 isoform X2 n=1 Tax=Physella acuta TaxID=109671 RepID=UPI0027DE5FFE|nr:uncharacterized protein LOC131935139 isoform X2 [Physella acuta]
MAHRLPPAGIETQDSDVFRFNVVHPPPCKNPKKEAEPVRCNLRPKIVCKTRDNLDERGPMQKVAHLLPPAGMDSEDSDCFRFYHVHAHCYKRKGRGHIEDQECVAEVPNTMAQPPLTQPGLLCNSKPNKPMTYMCHRIARQPMPTNQGAYNSGCVREGQEFWNL